MVTRGVQFQSSAEVVDRAWTASGLGVTVSCPMVPADVGLMDRNTVIRSASSYAFTENDLDLRRATPGSHGPGQKD